MHFNNTLHWKAIFKTQPRHRLLFISFEKLDSFLNGISDWQMVALFRKVSKTEKFQVPTRAKSMLSSLSERDIK